MTVLNQRLSQLTGLLVGRGASDGELQLLLKTETGRLAARMGDAAGPATQAEGLRRIDKDMKQHLSFLPASPKLNQESESYADFKWLYASPAVLVGINDEDNQVKADPKEALQFLRAGQHSKPRGVAWEDVGTRGRQHIIRLNRVRVSRSTFNAVRKMLADRTGQLRAACYAVAKRYLPGKAIPAWLERKMPLAEANGRYSLLESNLQSPDASIEFAICSKGVVSNPVLSARMQAAIKATGESLRAKLEKVAKGAKYVFETGQVFFERN